MKNKIKISLIILGLASIGLLLLDFNLTGRVVEDDDVIRIGAIASLTGETGYYG